MRYQVTMDLVISREDMTDAVGHSTPELDDPDMSGARERYVESLLRRNLPDPLSWRKVEVEEKSR